MTVDLSVRDKERDTTHALKRSARLFFSGTLLSRISGTLRDVIMAAAFGAAPAVAAFMMAYRFAHLLRRLLGEGAFQSAFIPYYEGQRLQSAHIGIHCFRAVSLALTLLLTLLIALSATLLFAIEQSALSLSEGNQQILHLTILLLPSLLFICLYGLNAALLQSHRRYFISSVAPVAFNLIWVAGTLALWGWPADQAMPLLAAVVLVACMGQWIATVPSVREIIREEDEAKEPINWSLALNQIKGLSFPLALGIFGVAASQINSAVDSLFARYADVEGPAFLWYAIRLQQAPLALFGIALSGALMPPLSRAAKREDWIHYQHLLNYAGCRAIELLLPLTLLLLFAAPAIVNLFYGRGHFDQKALMGTIDCLCGYGFGLLPMGLALLLAPAFYARGDYRWPSKVAFWIVFINILFNALLVIWWQVGAAAVAWSTSLCAWLNVILLSCRLKNVYEIELSSLFKTASLAFLGCVIGIILLSLWDQWFNAAPFWWQLWKGASLSLPRAFFEQAGLVTGEVIAFSIGYGIIHYCLKAKSQ